jgi:DNA-binding XRE family transcriptional regulator
MTSPAPARVGRSTGRLIRSEQNGAGRPVNGPTLEDMLEIVRSREYDKPPASAGGGRGPDPQGQEALWRQVLGSRLRDLRHERGERLTDIAGRAGLSPQYLSEIERGHKDPSSEMIAAIGGALGVTLVDLTLSIAETLIAREDRVHRAPRGLALAA